MQQAAAVAGSIRPRQPGPCRPSQLPTSPKHRRTGSIFRLRTCSARHFPLSSSAATRPDFGSPAKRRAEPAGYFCSKAQHLLSHAGEAGRPAP
jgi:hypothetical protein